MGLLRVGTLWQRVAKEGMLLLVLNDMRVHPIITIIFEYSLDFSGFILLE